MFCDQIVVCWNSNDHQMKFFKFFKFVLRNTLKKMAETENLLHLTRSAVELLQELFLGKCLYNLKVLMLSLMLSAAGEISVWHQKFVIFNNTNIKKWVNSSEIVGKSEKSSKQFFFSVFQNSWEKRVRGTPALS